MDSAIARRSFADLSWSIVPLVACAIACDGGSHTIGRFDGTASIGPAEGSDDDSFDEDSTDGDPESDEQPAPASCSGSEFTCVATAPAGWTGPFALFDGELASAPECGACMPMTVVQAFADLKPFAEQCDWTRAAVGCTADLGEVPGCAADETCMPVVAAPFEHGSCVLQDGDVACPRAPYLHKRVFHRGITADALDDDVCEPSEAGPAGPIAPDEPVTVCCASAIEPDPPG